MLAGLGVWVALLVARALGGVSAAQWLATARRLLEETHETGWGIT